MLSTTQQTYTAEDINYEHTHQKKRLLVCPYTPPDGLNDLVEFLKELGPVL